jgi:hypothetical protein
MVISALAAAVLYGAGAALEQRQAAAAPRSSAGRPRLLMLLVRQPLWLLGLGAQAAGFAAHAVALRSGPLATVQLLVAGELIVAVVLVRCWSGGRLGRASWAAMLTVVAGIAAFLLLTLPAARGGGLPRYHAGPPAELAAALAGTAAVAAAVAGLRAAGRPRAVLLALAAGLADSCAAVVTMAFSQVAGHGPTALATSWTGYALIVAGAGSVLLTQSAYQAGHPMITLPVSSAVTPVASAAIGIGLLGELPGTGLVAGLAAGLAVLVTALALAWLACSAPEPRRPPVGAPRRASGPAPEAPPEPSALRPYASVRGGS